MKRILFVDDEPLILAGLERMLYGLRRECTMEYANSGAAALKIMAEQPADVVVSDMRMPGMNGAELLDEIMRRYPKTVRIILSGYANEEMTLKCVGGTHQFLSKPCDCEVLRAIIRRVTAMDAWLDDERIKTLVSKLTVLPSLPALYFDILKELRSPSSDLERVGATIAQDPGMTMKILQLVNSAYFGLRRQIASPTDAVMQLGMETIKSLVLTIHIFSEFNCAGEFERQAEGVLNHSLRIAALAKKIAALEHKETRVVEECFTAGLLHDVGRVALMANLPEQYKQVIARARTGKISLIAAEREVFGVSHTEVGGYLLGIWGLPIALAEAAAFHHDPEASPNKIFSSLTAVHVANVWQQPSLVPVPAAHSPHLNEAYLKETGVSERIPAWHNNLCCA